MPRRKKLVPGMMVEYRLNSRSGPEWLPFLVTHVHGDDVVSGVLFTGLPGLIGLNDHGTEAYGFVGKGFETHQWRFVGEVEPQPEPEPVEEPPAEEPEETESAESE